MVATYLFMEYRYSDDGAEAMGQSYGSKAAPYRTCRTKHSNDRCKAVQGSKSYLVPNLVGRLSDGIALHRQYQKSAQWIYRKQSYNDARLNKGESVRLNETRWRTPGLALHGCDQPAKGGHMEGQIRAWLARPWLKQPTWTEVENKKRYDDEDRSCINVCYKVKRVHWWKWTALINRICVFGEIA